MGALDFSLLGVASSSFRQDLGKAPNLHSRNSSSLCYNDMEFACHQLWQLCRSSRPRRHRQWTFRVNCPFFCRRFVIRKYLNPFFIARLILFQVHERGKRIMFYNMMTLSTVTLSPIIGGYITETYGWRMQFYIIAGFLFLGIILLILACPEHAYSRPMVYETDVVAGEAHTAVLDTDASPPEDESMTEKPKTYIQELKPYSKNVTGENYLVVLARPFVCMLYPAVIWAFLLGGCWSTWVSSPTACR